MDEELPPVFFGEVMTNVFRLCYGDHEVQNVCLHATIFFVLGVPCLQQPHRRSRRVVDGVGWAMFVRSLVRSFTRSFVRSFV